MLRSSVSWEHLQRFYILSLVKHRVCQVSNQYEEEKKSYLQWFGKRVGKTQNMDPAIIFLGENFLRAVDSKVQATVSNNTQTLGTMETQCTYWNDESMAMAYVPPPQPA